MYLRTFNFLMGIFCGLVAVLGYSNGDGVGFFFLAAVSLLNFYHFAAQVVRKEKIKMF